KPVTNIFFKRITFQDSKGSPDGSASPAFLITVHLTEGCDLAIRDITGSSDPYVKFRHGKKLVYRSRTIFQNLNPYWNERFTFLIDDISCPLDILCFPAKVYDYDRFAADDYMGGASLYLDQLDQRKSIDMKVLLDDKNSDGYMGYLVIQICASPITETEKKQIIYRNSQNMLESSAGRKTPKRKLHYKLVAVPRENDIALSVGQIWNSVVNIILVKAQNLLPVSQFPDFLPDVFAKFKLGMEKYKSKTVSRTLDPVWLEQFDLHLFDDVKRPNLEITLFDKRKDLFMGRCIIDLNLLECEVTHQQWFELEDSAGQILLLITITGCNNSTSIPDISANFNVPSEEVLRNKYSTERRRWRRLTSEAKATHFAFSSYPILTYEHTPNVTDIHSVLEVTVYDEDANNRVEFLGKVVIPLLEIENGERRWYELKNIKLSSPAKGQIELEMFIYWNPIRAGIRTFQPKEKKFMIQDERFKRQIFMHNVSRLRTLVLSLMVNVAAVQKLLSWEKPVHSLLSLIVFVAATYFFEIYMIPLALLCVFANAYICKYVYQRSGSIDKKSNVIMRLGVSDEIINREFLGAFARRRRRRRSEQEYSQAFGSGSRHHGNGTTIPGLHSRAVGKDQKYIQLYTTVSILAGYFRAVSGVRVNKFTKKLRCPNVIPNNELLDFLSRVPSDDEIDCSPATLKQQEGH
ncbi:unnamed protein product, partial [Soboliphyme baturini]|uniref:C2 domain-containing protein n=1 Tax=Soboliphyme baturini TaxID=241478 RepID=A0A183INH3_9BILA